MFKSIPSIETKGNLTKVDHSCKELEGRNKAKPKMFSLPFGTKHSDPLSNNQNMTHVIYATQRPGQMQQKAALPADVDRAVPSEQDVDDLLGIEQQVVLNISGLCC